MEENRNAYRILMVKPEGKRPLRRAKRRWAYNIKIYLSEIECGGLEWSDLAQDLAQWRDLVDTVINLEIL
jgi:hypothetical protein